MNIPILYEDNHLLIVEKPINMPVQEDQSRDLDLLNYLKKMIKVRDNKSGNVYLSLVHRLDRPVGGAILLAKTSKAASRLANQMRKREIERTYRAIIRGSVKKSGDTLVNYLQKDRNRNYVHVVDKKTKGAKKALLTYKVFERKNDLSYLEVTLETGRSHQIRTQLAAIGHPLYGDQRYGKKVNKVGQQIALWSAKLQFIHPVRKTNITVKSTPPQLNPWRQFLR